MHITQYTDEQLQQELERRQAPWLKLDRHAALALVLRACAKAVANPPNDEVGEHQLNRACRLAYELAYHTLPGGGDDPASGMNLGWLSEGLPAEGRIGSSESKFAAEAVGAVLTVIEPRHAAERGHIERLTFD